MLKGTFYMIVLLLLSLFLGACGTEEAKEYEDDMVIERGPSVAYNIVKDEAIGNSQQREIHVSTFAYDEERYVEITRAVKDDYKKENLDAIQLHIYYPDHENNEVVGEKIAEAQIAYTEEGANQVGLEKTDSYQVKLIKGLKADRT